jgi:hypothetical protein
MAFISSISVIFVQILICLVNEPILAIHLLNLANKYLSEDSTFILEHTLHEKFDYIQSKHEVKYFTPQQTLSESKTEIQNENLISGTVFCSFLKPKFAEIIFCFSKLFQFQRQDILLETEQKNQNSSNRNELNTETLSNIFSLTRSDINLSPLKQHPGLSLSEKLHFKKLIQLILFDLENYYSKSFLKQLFLSILESDLSPHIDDTKPWAKRIGMDRGMDKGIERMDRIAERIETVQTLHYTETERSSATSMESIIVLKNVQTMFKLLIHAEAHPEFRKEFRLCALSLDPQNADIIRGQIHVNSFVILFYNYVHLLNSLNQYRMGNKPGGKQIGVRILHYDYIQDFEKKMAEWIQFSHIQEINKSLSMKIYFNYDQLQEVIANLLHLAPNECSMSEFYILYLNNLLCSYPRMEKIIQKTQNLHQRVFTYCIIIQRALDELKSEQFRRIHSSEAFQLLKFIFHSSLKLDNEVIFNEMKKNEEFYENYLLFSFQLLYLSPKAIRGYFREEILYHDISTANTILKALFNIFKKRISQRIPSNFQKPQTSNTDDSFQILNSFISMFFHTNTSFAQEEFLHSKVKSANSQSETEEKTFLFNHFQFCILRSMCFLTEKSGKRSIFRINDARLSDFCDNFEKIMNSFSKAEEMSEYIEESIILTNFEAKAGSLKSKNEGNHEKRKKINLHKCLKKEILKLLRICWLFYILSKIFAYRDQLRCIDMEISNITNMNSCMDNLNLGNCKSSEMEAYHGSPQKELGKKKGRVYIEFINHVLKLRNFDDIIKTTEIYQIILNALLYLKNVGFDINQRQIVQNFALYLPDFFKMNRHYRPIADFLIQHLRNVRKFEIFINIFTE